MMSGWNRLRCACFSLLIAVLFAFAAHNCQAQSYAGADFMADPQAMGATGAGADKSFSFIRNLQVSGFLQLTYGTFIDSEAIEYNNSKNSLSTARQQLQLDVNDTLGEHDRFFMRDWGVYEPSYPFENTCPQRFGPAR